jgi:hypothetical protein
MSSAGRSTRDAVSMVNNMVPVADYIKLGNVLNDLITNHNALCAKLDADAGVTDTNYTALLGIATLQSRLA